MKQKILIILNGIFGDTPHISGGDVRPLEMMRYWHKKGFEIHILSSEKIDRYVENSTSVILHLQPSLSLSNTKWQYIVRAIQSLWLPSSLKKESFDVVYSSNDTLFDVIPGWLLKLQGKTARWVVVSHWIPDWTFWNRQNTYWLSSLLFLFSNRLSIWLASAGADILFAVSPSTKKKLTHLGVNTHKVITTRCGVDMYRIRQVVKTVKKRKYDAIFMKRLESEKGIWDTITIWKQVVMKKPDAVLCIAGAGSIPIDELQTKISQAGLDKNIEIVGLITDFSKKINVLAQSHVLIHPSYQENWSMVIGEALASGTPVVAYDLPELKEIWRNKIIFIPSGHTEKAAKAVLNILKNKPDSLSLPEDWDWKYIAQNEMNYFSTPAG